VLEHRPPVAWPASLAGGIGIAVLAFAPHPRTHLPALDVVGGK